MIVTRSRLHAVRYRMAVDQALARQPKVNISRAECRRAAATTRLPVRSRPRGAHDERRDRASKNDQLFQSAKDGVFVSVGDVA